MTRLLNFENAAVQFRQGALTPRDYLEQAIAAIDARENQVHAFVRLNLDQARAQADASGERYRRQAPLSPIDGMPVGIKDIIDTADMPTEMGSGLYRGWRPKADAEAVDAIRLAGGVIVGKTRTTEFAIGRSDITANPHDPARTPGGSSSGTAAGVAAGMISAGLGTQTQGSVVRPASYCGAAGYKPTWGVLPLRGVHPLSASHDHLGVIAHSLDAAWDLARAILQYRPAAAGARLGAQASQALQNAPARRVAVLRTAAYAEMDAACLQAFDAELARWRQRGVNAVEPDGDARLAALCRELDTVPPLSLEMVAHDMRWPFWGYCQRYPELVSQKIHGLVADGLKVDPPRYQALCDTRAGILARLEALSADYDAFALPAASGVAPEGLEYTGSRTLLVYASFLGVPALNVPLLQVGHMPLGVQLISRRFDDYRLLCLAKWLANR
jgi:Asp-tRNA(Asn)/Glu-tRNA(Gln) amidotransferase A subunit family amidase